MKVVMYHYVHPKEDNWLKGLKSLDLKDFIRQLDFLQANFEILDPNVFLGKLEREEKISEESVLLTFDDGYKDHIDYVFPEMKKRGLKGLFFVPNYYKEKKLLEVNIIHLLLTKEEKIDEYLTFISNYLAEHGLPPVEDYIREIIFDSRYDSRNIVILKNLLQWQIPQGHCEIILEKLLAEHFEQPAGYFFDRFYCTIEDINELIRDGNVVGGHSVNHVWMGKCSPEQQEAEIKGSTELLEQLEKQSYRTFCYPFGSYDETSVRLLGENNYTVSFTTEAKPWSFPGKGVFEIPRMDTNDFPPKSENYKILGE